MRPGQTPAGEDAPRTTMSRLDDYLQGLARADHPAPRGYPSLGSQIDAGQRGSEHRYLEAHRQLWQARRRINGDLARRADLLAQARTLIAGLHADAGAAAPLLH